MINLQIICDSLNLSYGCGVQVVRACKLANKGYSVDEIVKELEEAVQNEFGINDMTKIEIGPTIGSHAGPGTIGICLYK